MNTNIRYPIALLVLVSGCLALTINGLAAPSSALEPANPKTNPKARAVLNYFHELSARTEGRRILSGQFSDFGNGANLRIMERIHEKTGHWPGLIGVDYADLGRGSLTYEVPNRTAIEYWRQGGLVTVMAHLYNPANPKGGGLRDQGVNLGDLLEPGSETHKRWMHELDLIAEGLQQLKDAGVVVLWRPFHEMNGGWFWWGAKDPDTFIRVWRQMFDYFSNTKGLDNLLWVYGPNHGQNTAKYYAGDRYVDIVGLDAYTDFIDRQHIRGYEEVAALPKPFGFTEYGPHGSRNPPGNYDYRQFIDGVLKEFPKTCFFMCWNARWSLASNENTKELLNHPSIVNREDIRAGPVASGRMKTPAASDDGTAAGWRKYENNPVLGGDLGTCFDAAVLRDGGRYRMWFSWRPKKSLALVESPDGVNWSAPVIVLGPRTNTKWEDDINRPTVVKRADGYHLWYTGQAHGRSWIGYATSPDGVTWKRMRETPVLRPEVPWEKGAVMCPHVLWDEPASLFRMWYSAGDQYEPDAIGYATSPDGLIWTRHAQNPVFTPDPKCEWEKLKVTACQVEKRGGWHVMFYIGFRDRDHAQIGLARSRNGIEGWERHPANPIIRPGENQWDQDACYKPYALFDGQKWLLWYNGRRGSVEQIGLAIHEGEDLGYP